MTCCSDHAAEAAAGHRREAEPPSRGAAELGAACAAFLFASSLHCICIAGSGRSHDSIVGRSAVRLILLATTWHVDRNHRSSRTVAWITMLVVLVAISDEMPLPSTDAFFSAALRSGGSSGS